MGRKRTSRMDECGQLQLKTEVLNDIGEDAEERTNDGNSYKRNRKIQGSRSTENVKHFEEADEAEQQDFRVYRKKAKTMDLPRVKEMLDLQQAKKLVLVKKKFGLRALREKRHVTLPYHLIGGNVLRSCESIAKMTVGKYRVKLAGVVVAIGSVRLASPARVIDDQNVFHIDIFVTQVVFRPLVNHIYEVRVTYIAADFISGLIFEAISINTPMCGITGEELRALTLQVGDTIEVKHCGITTKDGVCQLTGIFVRILRKGRVIRSI